MPKSKNYNNWLEQNFPRACHCGYISNNPSMHHYHKKTHEPIPEGQQCDHDCGQLAMFKGTGGKYTCSSIAQHCPGYLVKHSARVKKQWQGAIERKVSTAISLKERLHTPEVRAQQKISLKEKWGNFTPEQVVEYRRYARRIRSRAQRWAKANGHQIGKQTYHVDHKVSIWDCWKAGLSEEVVNHPTNLEILSARLNSSKGAKSTMTVDELVLLVEQST